MSINEDREGPTYNDFTKEYTDNTTKTTNTTNVSPESLGAVDLQGPSTVPQKPEERLAGVEKALQDSIYGEQWQEITERAIYAPTRFEYFVGLLLQGLVTGRAERDLKTAVRKALDLAKEVEELLDSQKDS